jgi:hypothetical protein
MLVWLRQSEHLREAYTTFHASASAAASAVATQPPAVAAPTVAASTATAPTTATPSTAASASTATTSTAAAAAAAAGFLPPYEPAPGRRGPGLQAAAVGQPSGKPQRSDQAANPPGAAWPARTASGRRVRSVPPAGAEEDAASDGAASQPAAEATASAAARRAARLVRSERHHGINPGQLRQIQPVRRPLAAVAPNRREGMRVAPGGLRKTVLQPVRPAR